ncbi:MAG: hypothetical protein COW88_02745 [Candidatus Lloydbacteria bacterium CG22_combo_CG10-13_8_21_14_all_47_15]|uniref:PDZ domain-containing protein n=1 Tax=Candidatus Lloydbacteria bacterium CG22_combo_CG10-13_8_21_14_all_47_15 TaxID=1974635 RepID=A0A2H0CUW5_9BACT|nr:MAG: hypothetical protein COW88_02745 [Candidatus Lloydbacteria bacterium CG22_combo_CG10-13_8_21_14_all_47_15]
MRTAIRISSILGVLLFVGAAFFAGVYAGYTNRPEVAKVTELIGVTPTIEEPVDFEPFWRAWNIINELYAETASSTMPSAQEKVWGAISGLADSLGDPYTVFLPPEESKIFQSDINGNFEGVGMEIGIRDDELTVVAPLKGTPAFRAGLLAGDKIFKINGEASLGMPVDEAIKLIRGPRGSTVTLSIIRKGVPEPFDVDIVRDVITVPVIDIELKDGVFVIALHSFTGTSPAAFRNALQEFVESGMPNLILDLRGNPGGFLEAAVDIASWFLPEGKVVVRENFGDEREERVYRSRGYDIFTDSLNFAILIDQGSASASEILAGALSEHGKATLVGDETFGKGSVQELIAITSDSSLKLTVARWLTPNGRSISEQKLSPDIPVEMTLDDFKAGTDPQLDRAIEYLQTGE